MNTNNSAAIYEKVCGNFLLARLNVRGIFERSVVWISRFSRDEGARGLILNAPMGKLMGECSPTFAGTAFARIPMHIGGPVDEMRLSVLACIQNLITGDRMIQLGLPPDRIRDLANDISARLFAFAGMASWAPKQLEDELASGTWLVVRADFAAWENNSGRELWNALLKKNKKLDAQLMLRAPLNLNEN